MNYDAIVEGKCPTCGAALERRATDGWCPTCKVGWAMWSRGGEGEVSITLEVDDVQFRDALGQAETALRTVGPSKVRFTSSLSPPPPTV